MSDVTERIDNCLVCCGVGWVCESHPNKPWDKSLANGCECNAGMPCRECNPCDYENPPKSPPGFKTVFDKDGVRH